jgi:uncharacterized membrane protein
MATRVTAIAAAALALAACQPRTEAQKEPQPAAPAPAKGVVSDFSQPMTALGTEPFWSVAIEGTRFTLKRPSQADVVFEAPGAAIRPGEAVWVAKAADGRQMTLTLRMGDCSDGMSDRTYPMSAEVVLLNESLHGCAVKTAEMPPEGG